MPRGGRVEHYKVIVFRALLYHLGDTFEDRRLLHARRVLGQRHVLVDFAAQIDRHQPVQRVGDLLHVQLNGLGRV